MGGASMSGGDDILELRRAAEHVLSEAGAHASHPYTEGTIRGVIILLDHIEDICLIEDEGLRNKFITDRTSLTAEKGFCAGDSKEARFNQVLNKVALLVATYTVSLERRTIEHYFYQAFDSDPCFNGRITQLTNYAMSQCGYPQDLINECPYQDEFSMLELNQLLDFSYGYFDGDPTPSLGGLRLYLSQRQAELSSEDSELIRRLMGSEKINQIYEQFKQSYL